MQPPLNLEQIQYTDEQIEWIRAATDIESMMMTPGWRRLSKFMEQLVEVAEQEALNANTSNPAHAMDLLREWQNKHDFWNQIQLYAASLLNKRDELAPANALEKLLLEEQLHARESRSTDDYSV